MTPAAALHAAMVRELEARGEPTHDGHLAGILGLARERVGQVRRRGAKIATLTKWCEAWASAGYPALTFRVGPDFAWAGRVWEVADGMADRQAPDR